MNRGIDDRGVSEVVGFILVFGMLVISFTVYQGIVVPDQNRQVEFQHNQEVQGDLQDLRNAIVRTAATGSGEAVSVTLGATYPDRTIAQNLGVSAGAVETIDTGGGLRVENVRATDPETRHYVDGSIGPFESKSIRYTPVYSFYGGAPRTTYENTFSFNRFSSANLTLTDQVIVDGRRITLVAVNGSLSEARRDTVSVSTEAISVSSNRVLVRNTSGQEITLTIPTTANESVWEEILADEMGASGHVVDVSAVPGMDAVSVSLEQGPTYELRMAKVGVGTGTTDEPATYITDVRGDGSSVSTGETLELVVEVRDRYNNPVSGVAVDVSDVTGGATVSPANSALSDADGRTSFTYTAPGSAGPESVTLSINDASSDREEVTFSLAVQGSDGGGGASGGNSAYDVFWNQPSGDQGLSGPCTTEDCTWDLDADSDESLTLTAGTDPPNLEGLDLSFAVDNGSIATITTSDDQTDADGTADVELQAGANGVVGVYVGSGGSSDRINITVQGVTSGLTYNDDAVAVDNPSDGDTTTGGIQFSVTNAFGQEMTITDITIDPSNNGRFQSIDDGIFGIGPLESELYIEADTTEGYTDYVGSQSIPNDGLSIDIGSDGLLNQEPVLSASSDATISFYQFQNPGGPRDTTGETFFVTLEYELEDGSTGSETFIIVPS